ncbi:TPA: ead/Ea22-like family protein [Enterobacter kobei]
MSNINKQALRETADAANKASLGRWESYHPHKGARGHEVKVGVKAIAQHCLKVDAEFIAAANPATVLALLDELEAAEKRIAELEARTVKLPEYRNSPDMHTKQFYEAIGFNQGLDVFIEALRAAGIGVKGE